MSRRLKLLIEGVLAVALVLGVSGFARSDQAIALSVDGRDQVVESRAATVGDLLAERDVDVSDRDFVQPPPEASLADVDEVVVRHARPIQVVIDGEPTQMWTTALTVDEALAELGVRIDAAAVSSRTDRLPLSGARVGVHLPDQVTVLHDDIRTTVVTTATSVAGVLRDAGVRLRAKDLINVGLGHKVEAGLQIVVTRVGTTVRTDRYRIAAPVVRRSDPSRYEGYEKVLEVGRPGVGVKQVRVVRHDGVVVRTSTVSRHILRPPVRRVVVVGTKERPYNPPSTGADGLNWAALAQCESGGNPRAVNPAGYYGLYQFALGTWASVGGSGNPIDASAEEQTYRAKILFSRSGAAPWPVCGPLLFT